MGICESMKKLCSTVNVSDFNENDTVDELIDKYAGGVVFGSSNVTVAASDKESYWGTAVSAMQTSIVVSGGKITGTLHKLTSGQLVKDWGAGFFIALKFTKNNAAATSIKVGLRPSVSSGLQELDADMDAVLKITDKNAQVVEVRCSNGTVAYSSLYDVSELTLSNT